MRILIGIPTRDRPGYLAGLLSTILFQSHTEFDVLVVDTAPKGDTTGSPLYEDPHITRLGAALDSQGCNLTVRQVGVSGRSEATAVNHILCEAAAQKYAFVFKVDDDHVLPPTALESLLVALDKAESRMKERGVKAPALVSGVTPWMHRVWEGACGPDDKTKRTQELRPPVTDVYLRSYDATVRDRGYAHEIDIGHFDKYDAHGLVQTKLASAANFLMRPDTRLLWSDVGQSSLFADAIWFLQLQKFLGYELYFEPGTWVWHVVAPSGGVRESEEDHDKKSWWDQRRRIQLDRLLMDFGMGDRGCLSK